MVFSCSVLFDVVVLPFCVLTHGAVNISPHPPPHSVSEHDFMTHMEVENHDDYYTFETDGRIIVSDSTGTNIIYDAALVDLR